jgi:hypothetical protein
MNRPRNQRRDNSTALIRSLANFRTASEGPKPPASRDQTPRSHQTRKPAGNSLGTAPPSDRREYSAPRQSATRPIRQTLPELPHRHFSPHFPHTGFTRFANLRFNSAPAAGGQWSVVSCQWRAPDVRRRAPDVRRRAPDVRRRAPDVRRRAPDVSLGITSLIAASKSPDSRLGLACTAPRIPHRDLHPQTHVWGSPAPHHETRNPHRMP